MARTILFSAWIYKVDTRKKDGTEKLFKTMTSVLILLVGLLPFQAIYLFEFSGMGKIFHNLRYDEHSMLRPIFQGILGITSTRVGNILLGLSAVYGGIVAVVAVIPFSMLIPMLLHMCINCLQKMS